MIYVGSLPFKGWINTGIEEAVKELGLVIKDQKSSEIRVREAGETIRLISILKAVEMDNDTSALAFFAFSNVEVQKTRELFLKLFG